MVHDRDNVPREIIEEVDRVFGEAEAKTGPGPMQDSLRDGSAARAKLLPDDMVLLPKHYSRFKIEPIHFIGENNLDFLLGNFIKYGMRAEHKHSTPVQDTLKAIRYAIMRCKKLMGVAGWAGPYKVASLEQSLTEELS
jgi:hypothetical protein